MLVRVTSTVGVDVCSLENKVPGGTRDRPRAPSLASTADTHRQQQVVVAGGGGGSSGDGCCC